MTASDLHSIRVTVNGRRHELTVESRRSLAEVLREEVGTTGVRIGCEHGVCGSCTVLLEGQPVRSCLMLAVQADGKEVRTIESMAAGAALHPIQESFRQEHALQCGFCTAGIVLSVSELLERCSNPTEEQIMDVLGGHLCRCTGYQQILDAVKRAALQAGGT